MEDQPTSTEESKTKSSAQPPAPEETAPRRKGPRKAFVRRDAAPSEFIEKVIAINRVAKVTKGGKKLSFGALVVVGDGKGRVGYSLEKSNEVATSIKKALIAAKKNMITVSLNGSTIAHQIIGVCGAAVVMLKPALEGTGVIAAGPVRAVCDAVGIRNILTKCHRSNNPINVVKATLKGLESLRMPEEVVARRKALVQGPAPVASEQAAPEEPSDD